MGQQHQKPSPSAKPTSSPKAPAPKSGGAGNAAAQSALASKKGGPKPGALDWLGAAGQFKGGLMGAGAGLLQAPGQLGSLFGKDKSLADRTQAGSGLLNTASMGLQGADKANRTQAAASALRGVAPDAAKGVVGKGASAAATASLAKGGGKGSQAVMAALTGAAGDVGGIGKAMGTTGRAAGRGLAKGGSKAAAAAATKAGAGLLGKSAARFVPGMNVAMAGLDSATFLANMADSKASVGKKATSGITALGSIAAATNIPIVSQVGAGVSILGSLAGGFFD